MFSHTTRIAPLDDQAAPTGYMSNDIPVITIATFSHGLSEATLALGNHSDPVAYLREFAANMAAFADEVAAHRAGSKLDGAA